MSKSIRKIIGEAYKFIGLAPNGILHDGQVSEGVDFANEVIKKYNESSLFPFTYSTLDAVVSGGCMTISPTAGEGVTVGEAPVGMAAAYWKRSATDMIKIRRIDFKDIFPMRNTSASPEWYSIVTETDDRVKIHFDALGTFNVFLVYPKALPRLEIDDTFVAPEIYEQVVKYGVAVRAAVKAVFEDSVVAGYQKLLDDAVRAITDSNASKKPVKRNFTKRYNHHDEFMCPRVRF